MARISKSAADGTIQLSVFIMVIMYCITPITNQVIDTEDTLTNDTNSDVNIYQTPRPTTIKTTLRIIGVITRPSTDVIPKTSIPTQKSTTRMRRSTIFTSPPIVSNRPTDYITSTLTPRPDVSPIDTDVKQITTRGVVSSAIPVNESSRISRSAVIYVTCVVVCMFRNLLHWN